MSAQLQLVEGQLARTRIVAPFSGLVTSGDLRQRLGGSVAKGEVLFEVAPLNAYRMILEVDERRIADVKTDQRGVAVLSALPNEHFEFVVRKVTPIAMGTGGAQLLSCGSPAGHRLRAVSPGHGRHRQNPRGSTKPVFHLDPGFQGMGADPRLAVAALIDSVRANREICVGRWG